MSQSSARIITLQLDEDSSAFFNDLRRKYFPPAINYLAAHLTLFHHLPASEPSVEKDLNEWCKGFTEIALQVTAVKSIGKGVAYKVESATLTQLHKKMQDKWQQWLIPQDKQKLWPHITVQNKVTPAVAGETLQVLQRSFKPFTARGLGFSLWSYEGGPWTFIKNYTFEGE